MIGVGSVILCFANRLMRPATRRKPKLPAENVGSKSGCSTWCRACWISRSTRVGTPTILDTDIGQRKAEFQLGAYNLQQCIRLRWRARWANRMMGYWDTTGLVIRRLVDAGIVRYCPSMQRNL